MLGPTVSAMSPARLGVFLTSLRPPHASQMKAVLRILAQFAASGRPPADVAHIVQCYSAISRKAFCLPRWRNIPELDKFILYAGVGGAMGMEHALTFNLSNTQRIDWVEGFGNVTRGFKRKIIEPLRSILGEDLLYWMFVEPKVSTSEEVKAYTDCAEGPRRFDIHGALKVPDSPGDIKMKRVQKHLWNHALKIAPVSGTEDFPLYKFKRMARLGDMYDKVGWEAYSSKVVRHTRKYHADVVGSRPMGVSLKIQREARRFYDEVKFVFETTKPDPSYLFEAFNRYHTSHAEYAKTGGPPFPLTIAQAAVSTFPVMHIPLLRSA